MSAHYEAICLAGFLAFLASAPLIGIAASGHWNRWLIAPFATLGIAGFWLWTNWILRSARVR